MNELNVDISVLEGYLDKHSSSDRKYGSKKNRRWFKVDYATANDNELALCYYKSSNSKEPRGWIYLKDVKKIDAHKSVIEISTVSRKFRLEAKSSIEHQLWLEGLRGLYAYIEEGKKSACVNEEVSNNNDKELIFRNAINLATSSVEVKTAPEVPVKHANIIKKEDEPKRRKKKEERCKERKVKKENTQPSKDSSSHRTSGRPTRTQRKVVVIKKKGIVSEIKANKSKPCVISQANFQMEQQNQNTISKDSDIESFKNVQHQNDRKFSHFTKNGNVDVVPQICDSQNDYLSSDGENNSRLNLFPNHALGKLQLDSENSTQFVKEKVDEAQPDKNWIEDDWDFFE